MGPPLRRKRTGSVGSAKAGAVVKPQQRQFLHAQGPVARREFRPPLRFCAPEMFCPPQGVTPVMGVLGADSPCQGEMSSAARQRGQGRAAWRREACRTADCACPLALFGDFLGVQKVTRRPQAAKSPPAVQRTRSETCPLIAPVCALGRFPPRGEGFLEEDAPSPAPQGETLQNRAAAKIPPQGKPFAFFPKLCYNNSKMPDYALIWRYPCPTYKY